MKSVMIIFLTAFVSLSVTDKEVAPRSISDNIVMCSGPAIKGLVYERNDEMEKTGTCYGYVNCTACSTCNYCGHCTSGGSCGVCSIGNSWSYKSKKKKKSTNYTIKPEASNNRNSSNSNSNNKSNTSTISIFSNTKYKVTGNVVNIRTGPSTSYTEKDRVTYGNRLIGKKRTKNKVYISKYGSHYWYYVEYSGGEGWIYGGLIEEDDGLTITSQEMLVTGNKVNVRDRPSTVGGKKLFKLNKGDMVLFLGEKTNYEKIAKYGYNYWYKIECYKGIGWIYGGLIK